MKTCNFHVTCYFLYVAVKYCTLYTLNILYLKVGKVVLVKENPLILLETAKLCQF